MNHENGRNDSKRSGETGDSIIVECELQEPPEKVWRALTIPDLVAAWLMPNDIRPEVGSRFRFQAEPDAGHGAIECEVLEAEPRRLLRYSWRAGETGRDAGGRALDTVVTFLLTETDSGGTRLRVVHSGFPPSLRQTMALSASAVPGMLAKHIQQLPRNLRAWPRRTVLAAGSTTRRGMRLAA